LAVSGRTPERSDDAYFNYKYRRTVATRGARYIDRSAYCVIAWQMARLHGRLFTVVRARIYVQYNGRCNNCCVADVVASQI